MGLNCFSPLNNLLKPRVVFLHLVFVFHSSLIWPSVKFDHNWYRDHEKHVHKVTLTG